MEATPSPATARPAKKASPLGSPRFYGSSPTFRTRLDEKETLQNLNDRFAVYIERMRTLEERNSSLSAEITTWKEKEKSEVSEVKTMFESELANARVLLDEISKEKSRVELENNRNVTLAADLLKKLEAEKAARKKADDKCAMLDRKLNDKEASLSTLQSEYNKLKERYDSLTLENKNLSSALDSTQYDLEQKTLDKVDLENRIQTLTEDLDFKKRTYEQELAEIRTQVSSVETSRVYMETDYKQKYDTIMKDKLQELRDEFEEEAENVKKDVENTYKHKIDDLKGNTEKTRHECNRQIIIIRDLRSTIDTLKIEKNVSETEVISLRKRVEDLENLRLRERDDLTKQLNDKIDEIKDLNDRIDEMQKEYEELMGIKVALDLEISAYRKLLEGEEERLNITPTTTPSRKRPRTDSDAAEQPVLSTAKGSIQISECDPTGNFVKLANTGGNEEPLGGWVVRRAAADQPPVEFKFNPRSILKAGAAVAIWSACSGMKHKPPTDLVMKTADWGPGPDAVTTLHNSEGEVVAQMTETSPTDIGTRAGLRRKRRADKNESCIIS